MSLATAPRVGNVAGRERAEAALRASGQPLGLPQRAEWSLHLGRAGWHLVATDTAGTVAGTLAATLAPMRSLPGHLIARAARVGGALPAAVRATLVSSLVARARGDGRVVRVHVELFNRDAAARAGWEATLAAAGFAPVAPASYTRTIAVDLALDDDARLAALGYSTRRKVRAPEKHPVRLAPVDDVAHAPRLDALLAETMARTGGTPVPHDWPAILALSAAHPHLSRIVGLFRTDVAGPEALLAYAWGCHHGDHASYETAASTRATDLRLPMGYSLAWDLMSWARRHGATWFDFGGITDGSARRDDADALGGISDFKRAFSECVIEVGAEWLYEPRPARSALARAISRGAGWLAARRAPRVDTPAAPRAPGAPGAAETDA